MPFGKQFIRLETGPVSFFSSPHTNPDEGITLALKTMGWTCQVHRGGDVSAALSSLRTAVSQGPVLAGPLNMGYLTYNPEYKNLGGADHFVIVLKVDDNDDDDARILLHDPAGYPAVLLPLAEFLKAWRGEGVEYADQPFVFRSGFQRVDHVSRTDMITRTLGVVQEQFSSEVEHPDNFGGVTALQLTAEAVAAAVPSVVNDLAAFTLPLAARRYLDARDFLTEAGLCQAAEIMEQQALLAGKAQYLAVHKNWKDIIAILEELAKLEDRLITIVRAL
ncbi:uncharacterized protein ATNIH1004_011564 [Aspergillus tanneri]|nr:uncharacterized protein ATNIH1004_011564 [Aspergillus tanneri]KAA8642619.1 hypothetical protein ATNIH1004_011564 [Aspergillus tanneri]